MNPQEYETAYRMQATHFFYETRRRLYSGLAAAYIPNGDARGRLILDAGCGSGGIFDAIGKYGRLVGCEISELAIRLCERGKCVGLVQGSVNILPFREDSFDVVACLGVLYHRGIEEAAALSELFRVCKPGGLAFVSTPACQFLFGEKDLAVHTRHRYTKKELARAVRRAGFAVEKCSYFYASLLAPMVVTRSVERLRKLFSSKAIDPAEASSGLKPPWSPINEMIVRILTMENKIGLRVELPFGVEVACVARK